MYLSRYGRGDPVLMLERPTVELLSWADQVHEFLQEEARQAEAARKR